MAGVNPVRSLQEEATCSICLEYYAEPVMLDCGHNFCRACITGCWDGSDTELLCPECRVRYNPGNLRPNRQLLSMVQITKQLLVQAAAPQEEVLCEKHEERLKLFCKEDQRLICLICRESQDHRTHTAFPIDEAAQQYKEKLQAWLLPLRKEMEGILECKRKEEEQYKTMRNTLRAERQNIVIEFQRLRQLLKEHEQTLLRRLEELGRTITMAENANAAKVSNQMSSLNALITEIEEKCTQQGEELLQDVRSTLSKCENVRFLKSEAIMKKDKVLVTLDPDTASRWLILSENGRRVRCGDTAQTPPDNPKRFTIYPCVLGREGFSSGRHYWEVQLLQEGIWGWDVGAAREFVSREGRVTLSPEEGVWAVRRWCNGRYWALTSPRCPLSLHESPRKLGVHLDYEGGWLSLYNAESMEHLYTFTNTAFTERVFPFFWIWSGAELRLV